MLPVIREIQRTGGLGVIARPVRSTSGALRLRFSRAAALGRPRMDDTGVVHFREVSIKASKAFAVGSYISNASF